VDYFLQGHFTYYLFLHQEFELFFIYYNKAIEAFKQAFKKGVQSYHFIWIEVIGALSYTLPILIEMKEFVKGLSLLNALGFESVETFDRDFNRYWNDPSRNLGDALYPSLKLTVYLMLILCCNVNRMKLPPPNIVAGSILNNKTRPLNPPVTPTPTLPSSSSSSADVLSARSATSVAFSNISSSSSSSSSNNNNNNNTTTTTSSMSMVQTMQGPVKFPLELSLIEEIERTSSFRCLGYVNICSLSCEVLYLYELYDQALELALVALDPEVTLKPTTRSVLYRLLAKLFHKGFQDKEKCEKYFSLSLQEADKSCFRDVIRYLTDRDRRETIG
jgi:hypothetical protein